MLLLLNICFCIIFALKHLNRNHNILYPKENKFLRLIERGYFWLFQKPFIDPFVAAAHPMPKIAILTLILIIFGIGELSKVMAVAIAAFFPMLINTMAGVEQISPLYFEVAQNYGANEVKVFTGVILPGSLFMITVLGILLDFTLQYIALHIIPWHEVREA